MATQADGIACGQCGRFVLNGELHQCDTLVITAGAPPAPDSAFNGGCLSAGGTMEHGASGILDCGCAYENGRAAHLCDGHFNATARAGFRARYARSAADFIVPRPARREGLRAAVVPQLTPRLASLWSAITGEPVAPSLPPPPCAACDALDSKCWRHR